MARISRLIAFLLGGICAAYAAGALFLLATWDGVRVRNELVLELRERCERRLTMEGAPRLHFAPWPTLVMETLALGEPAGPGIIARASRVEARLALWALVAGRLEVTRLAFIDPDLRIARRPDGKANLADLFENSSGANWPARFALESLEIERGKLDLVAANGESWLKLERANFTLGPLAVDMRGDLRGAATLIQGPGSASGGLEFSFAYLPGAQGYGLESANLRFRGDAWGATALDTQIAIGGGHNGGEAFVLNGLSLRGHGRVGVRSLDLDASAEQLASKNGLFALRGVKANFVAANGDERFEALLESPTIATRSAEFQGAPLRATFSNRTTARNSEGRLSGRVVFRPEAQRLTLDGLALQWNVAATQGKMAWTGNANGRTELAPSGQAALLKLQASYAGARGRIAADYDPARPLPLQIDLDADTLDLGRLASASGYASLPELATAVSTHAFTARLRATNLALAGLHASRASTTLTVGGGRLQFADLNMDAYGGTLAGSLDYQPVARRLLLDQRFSRIALAPLFADLRATDLPLRGELTGAWKLAAVPGAWSDMSRSLTGSAQLTLRNAQWLGMDIAEFLRAVRPALRNRQHAERIAAPREREEFDSLALACNLAGGHIDCTDFNAENNWLRLAGGGRLQFGATLAWRTRIEILPHAIPRDLVGLRGIVVPVRLDGLLQRPLWQLDWTAVPPREPAKAPTAPPPARRETPSMSARAAG